MGGWVLGVFQAGTQTFKESRAQLKSSSTHFPMKGKTLLPSSQLEKLSQGEPFFLVSLVDALSRGFNTSPGEHRSLPSYPGL